jgi:lysozyme
MSQNLQAFLAMVRHSEGTDKYPNPWAVCFEGKFTITDFTDHPAVMGTWHGEPLDFLGPRYAGLRSTAAGAYQLIKPTWLGCRIALDLPDFSPDSQDKAAAYLISHAGAMPFIESGDIATAIIHCRSLWASLPGGGSGQPQVPLASLTTAYLNGGGSLA